MTCQCRWGGGSVATCPRTGRPPTSHVSPCIRPGDHTHQGSPPVPTFASHPLHHTSGQKPSYQLGQAPDHTMQSSKRFLSHRCFLIFRTSYFSAGAGPNSWSTALSWGSLRSSPLTLPSALAWHSHRHCHCQSAFSVVSAFSVCVLARTAGPPPDL